MLKFLLVVTNVQTILTFLRVFYPNRSAQILTYITGNRTKAINMIHDDDLYTLEDGIFKPKFGIFLYYVLSTNVVMGLATFYYYHQFIHRWGSTLDHKCYTLKLANECRQLLIICLKLQICKELFPWNVLFHISMDSIIFSFYSKSIFVQINSMNRMLCSLVLLAIALLCSIYMH